MIVVVALVGPFAPVIVVALALRVIRSERREHIRAQETLVNQVCNLSGHPWLPAPAEQYDPTPEVERESFSVSPEQDLILD